MNQYQQESWIKRNGLWFFPLLILMLGAPVICCGGFAFLGYTAAGIITGPTSAAIDAVKNDPEIAARLGEDIQSGGSTQLHDMQINNDTGHVELKIRAVGSQSGADVEGTVVMENGDWFASDLTVTFDDGTEKKIGRNQ